MIRGLGRKTIHKLIAYLTQEKLNNLEFNELIDIIQRKISSRKISYNLEALKRDNENILHLCYKNNIKIISLLDDEYPKKLLNINDKPVILYIQGNKEMLDESKNIAIVGSRRPTRKGYEISSIIAEKLAKEGYNIISGLALGCDTAGHRGCLYGNGKTAAAIPSGHEYVYPRANKGLYYQILENDGCIVSELVPLSKPIKVDFINRDRLQAAFSEGIIVIESTLNSGTIHTVKYSIEYGKLIACSGHKSNENPGNFKLNEKLLKERIAYKINNFDDLINFTEKAINYKLSIV